MKDEKGIPYGDTGTKDGFGHAIAGGVAQSLADLIVSEFKLKSRAEMPGILGRVNMACVSSVDRQEAYDAGVFAVKSAVEGSSGYLVAIEAERNPRYMSKMKLVPLEKVANVEKRFPEAWINDDGQYPAGEFAAYCLPLIGQDMPEYAYIGFGNDKS
jgi:6-phosphofructokinase 1